MYCFDACFKGPGTGQTWWQSCAGTGNTHGSGTTSQLPSEWMRKAQTRPGIGAADLRDPWTPWQPKTPGPGHRATEIRVCGLPELEHQSLGRPPPEPHPRSKRSPSPVLRAGVILVKSDPVELGILVGTIIPL